VRCIQELFIQTVENRDARLEPLTVLKLNSAAEFRANMRTDL